MKPAPYSSSSARRPSARPGDERAQRGDRPRVVGHDEELVHGVELDEPAEAAVGLHERAPPVAGEHALDEVLADPRVVEAPLVLHGDEGEALREGAREDADPAAGGVPLLVVDLHAAEARAGRARLEHEAAEVLRVQLRRALPGPGFHARGEVDAAADREQARGGGVADEAHGLAGYAQAALHLGAHRHPADEAAQHVTEVAVELVPPVVAHVVAEEAGADAQGNAFVGHAAIIPQQTPE